MIGPNRITTIATVGFQRWDKAMESASAGGVEK